MKYLTLLEKFEQFMLRRKGCPLYLIKIKIKPIESQEFQYFYTCVYATSSEDAKSLYKKIEYRICVDLMATKTDLTYGFFTPQSESYKWKQKITLQLWKNPKLIRNLKKGLMPADVVPGSLLYNSLKEITNNNLNKQDFDNNIDKAPVWKPKITQKTIAQQLRANYIHTAIYVVSFIITTFFTIIGIFQNDKELKITAVVFGIGASSLLIAAIRRTIKDHQHLSSGENDEQR